MSVEDHQVSFSLDINVEPAHTSTRKLQMVIYRTLSLIRRLGLPEGIDAGIAKIMNYIRVINRLRLALAALQAARMASGDPLAWATAAVSFGALGADFGDMIMEGF